MRHQNIRARRSASVRISRSSRRRVVINFVVFACALGVATSAGAATPGSLIGSLAYIGESRNQVADIRSSPLRLPNGDFLVRADTNEGAPGDPVLVDSRNARLSVLKLNSRGKVIRSFARTQIGKGLQVLRRSDYWFFETPVYLGANKVSVTGYTDGLGVGGIPARATIVFDARSGRLVRSFGRRGKLVQRFRSPSLDGSTSALPAAAAAAGQGRLLECGSLYRGNKVAEPRHGGTSVR